MPLFFLPVLLMTACSAPSAEALANDYPEMLDSLTPPIVLELFTSQGCSSCPPADELLGAIISQAEESGQPIYALAFHVDYWNRLGWEDPYSQEAFSHRQYEYSGKLPSRVYTPQLVINGSKDVVGSRSDYVLPELQPIARAIPLELSLATPATQNEGWTADFQLSGDFDPEETVVNVAVVERELNTAVKRGENRNRVLNHYNVVREFQQYGLTTAGNGRLELERPATGDDFSLLIYLQDLSSWQVLGAESIDLP